MPPEPDAPIRILGLGAHLPGRPVTTAAVAARLGASGDDLEARSGVKIRHWAEPGQGPSDLALIAAQQALADAGTAVADLGLIIFATATPDVCFPGAACYLQHKLGAPQVGALDLRAQTSGFLCGLDLALTFSGLSAHSGGRDGRYARVLLAAAEVHSTALDYSPGADLTPRFGDGAAAVVVGAGERGARCHALRWAVDGTLADRFWCEIPASGRYPRRLLPADFERGSHYPKADLASLSDVVRGHLVETTTAVLADCDWRVADVARVLIDYVEPGVARAAAAALGFAGPQVVVPTEQFGHVMNGGLPLALAAARAELGEGTRVLLAEAGPGLTWGAAALEL